MFVASSLSGEYIDQNPSWAPSWQPLRSIDCLGVNLKDGICCCSTTLLIPLWYVFFARPLLVGRRTNGGIERLPDNGSFDDITKRPWSVIEFPLRGGAGHDLYSLSRAASAEEGVASEVPRCDTDGMGRGSRWWTIVTSLESVLDETFRVFRKWLKEISFCGVCVCKQQKEIPPKPELIRVILSYLGFVLLYVLNILLICMQGNQLSESIHNNDSEKFHHWHRNGDSEIRAKGSRWVTSW